MTADYGSRWPLIVAQTGRQLRPCWPSGLAICKSLYFPHSVPLPFQRILANSGELFGHIISLYWWGCTGTHYLALTVVGRKSWLFCDTHDGAKANAVIYSVIETAKANNLNTEKYLAYLLTILPGRCARDNDPAVDDLMPWQDQVRKACGAEY